jgi:hypothetical protein
VHGSRTPIVLPVLSSSLITPSMNGAASRDDTNKIYDGDSDSSAVQILSTNSIPRINHHYNRLNIKN